ncbi:putative RING finger protein C32F12.07c [Wickerhamiella sorbophila]|uniref:Putative RING finger protein C32F12.07c n=1 Tax=Wickerhamiella sorbophila TaxID=45607 RepID=A0A2T0FD03_9ASCO|nr:putative RING finger protein C32F12.07c [Wickerhamiella sorbophila]PRT52847.1 putative RING finger protein C32F12.07c [Wickerhamiella sorbophila]
MGDQEVSGKSCWICLATETDEPPGGAGKAHNWRKICNCNLYAHEECLIYWAVTQDNETKCCCPQCQTPIRIRKQSSTFLSLRQVLDKIISGLCGGALTGAVLGCLGGALSAGTYALLYGTGASYINLLCSPAQRYRILGPFVEAVRADVRPIGLSLGGLLRRAFLIPQIPLALVASASRKRWATFYLTLLPYFASSELGRLEPFQRSLLLVVALRHVHRVFYDVVVGRTLHAAARVIKGVSSEEDAGVDLGEEMRVFEEALERAMVPLENEQLPEDQDPEMRERLLNLNVLVPDGPELDFAELHDIAGEMRQVFRNNRPEPRPVDEAGAADWVLGTQSAIKNIAYPLLLPYAGVAVARLLRFIPFLRHAPIFELNLAGSVIVVLVRDAVNVVTALYRIKQSATFRVLNYNESDTSEANWVEKLAKALTPHFQFEIQARFE